MSASPTKEKSPNTSDSIKIKNTHDFLSIHSSKPDEEFWRLSNHENVHRMRLKLEPALYHDPHTAASNLRDNTASSTSTSQGLSGDLGTTITAAALGNEIPDDEQFLLEEEMRNSMEPQV